MGREEVRHLFCRVCQDSGFRMDAVSAAVLAARAAQISPLEIWIAVGDLYTMERIASGAYPSAALQERDNG